MSMRVGEKAILKCRQDYAYGDSGSPPTIPGGVSSMPYTTTRHLHQLPPPPFNTTTALHARTPSKTITQHTIISFNVDTIISLLPNSETPPPQPFTSGHHHHHFHHVSRGHSPFSPASVFIGKFHMCTHESCRCLLVFMCACFFPRPRCSLTLSSSAGPCPRSRSGR
jgi:hypothetical protein